MINCAVERGCHIQSSLLEAVREVMLKRIRDKVQRHTHTHHMVKQHHKLQTPVVRVHAAKALELLQEDVLLQEELVGLLQSDPSPDVRIAVLNTIVVSGHTFPGQ